VVEMPDADLPFPCFQIQGNQRPGTDVDIL
jgi:hypothetical protein